MGEGYSSPDRGVEMNTTAFYDFWARWFAQSEAEKLRHLRSPGKGGYYPTYSEAPGYEAKPDPKEYFHWRIGQGHPDEYMHHDDTYGVTEDLFFECISKADRWCEDHDLAELSAEVRIQDCVLRIIHYPPTPDGNVGQAHRDFDLLTVSVPGTVPGLEVWGVEEITLPNGARRSAY